MLGTENPSHQMAKYVDSKLLGEHVRNMGCEFITGRAELAPQVVQEVGVEIESEDVADFVDDTLRGLITTSMCEQSTSRRKAQCNGIRSLSWF